MKSFKLLSFSLLVLVFGKTNAQLPFNVYDSINVGNVNAKMSPHGDLWNSSGLNAGCEFPKGSGKHVAFLGGLWMGGYVQGNLHVSAQTYRNNGIDFWPGPLDSLGGTSSIAYAKSEKWAKIWKINRSDLNQHLANAAPTLSNTPVSILEWPGKGNVHAKGNNGAALTFSNNHPVYAPFVDKNSNGIYEPLLGDYPKIKGDQAAWFVYNDSGPTHDASKTMSLQVQVSCLAYAYSRNTIADNIIFYEKQILHLLPQQVDSFTIGIFGDFDLGYAFDDYIGFDSSRNLYYSYNGNINDLGVYNDTIPAVGVTVLRWSQQDTCGGNTASAGSFMYYNSNADTTSGAPNNGTQYYNYLTGTFRNGRQLMNDYSGPGIPSNGLGNGVPAKFLFNGDPANSNEWSECTSANVPFDRRGVLGSKQQTILPGQIETFAFALLAAPRKKPNACPAFNLQDLRALADTASALFCSPPIFTAIPATQADNNKMLLHPNPAVTYIDIDGNMDNPKALKLYDALGRSIEISGFPNAKGFTLNVASLSPGVYYLVYTNGSNIKRGSFVKE